MAIYKIFPEKDATLYTQDPDMNTGLDEILEASTYLLDSNAQTSRYLIKFSQTSLNTAFDAYVSSSGGDENYINKLHGNLFGVITDNPSNLDNSISTNIYPITASTGNGIGGKIQLTVGGNTITAANVQNSRVIDGKGYKPGDVIELGGLLTTAQNLTTASFTLTAGNFIPRDWNSNLRNYAAVVTNLNSTSFLKVYPISQSWDMGTGRFGNSPVTKNGCSWTGSTADKEWHQDLTPYTARTTASYSSVYGGTGGGTWFTGSATLKDIVQTQTFTYADSIDLNVDVTNTVDIWISQSKGVSGGDIPNEGFIIKQTSSVEFIPSESQASTFKFYSVDTNTIYPPQIDFKFDDFFYFTSSEMATLAQPEAFISSYNNDGVYFSESIQRFRIAAVPQYPKKVFQTQSGYLTNFYLPQTSYYAIKDSETNEYVIEFDNTFTQVSADTTSSYFDIYMGGLEPERYYTILLKTTVDGTTKVFDEDIMFKVING